MKIAYYVWHRYVPRKREGEWLGTVGVTGLSSHAIRKGRPSESIWLVPATDADDPLYALARAPFAFFQRVLQ